MLHSKQQSRKYQLPFAQEPTVWSNDGDLSNPILLPVCAAASKHWKQRLENKLLPNIQEWRLIANAISSQRAEILIPGVQLNMRTTPHFRVIHFTGKLYLSQQKIKLSSNNIKFYHLVAENSMKFSLRYYSYKIPCIKFYQQLSRIIIMRFVLVQVFYYQNIPDDHSHHSCIYT